MVCTDFVVCQTLFDSCDIYDSLHIDGAQILGHSVQAFLFKFRLGFKVKVLNF